MQEYYFFISIPRNTFELSYCFEFILEEPDPNIELSFNYYLWLAWFYWNFAVWSSSLWENLILYSSVFYLSLGDGDSLLKTVSDVMSRFGSEFSNLSSYNELIFFIFKIFWSLENLL